MEPVGIIKPNAAAQVVEYLRACGLSITEANINGHSPLHKVGVNQDLTAHSLSTRAAPHHGIHPAGRDSLPYTFSPLTFSLLGLEWSGRCFPVSPCTARACVSRPSRAPKPCDPHGQPGLPRGLFPLIPLLVPISPQHRFVQRESRLTLSRMQVSQLKSTSFLPRTNWRMELICCTLTAPVALQAAQKGHRRLIEWFVNGGGRDEVEASGLLEQRDNDGNLPSDCARLEGHSGLAALLQHFGKASQPSPEAEAPEEAALCDHASQPLSPSLA